MRKIYGQQWFKPREIADMGLIQNSKGEDSTASGNYSYVIKLIKSGRLRAKNYSKGKTPYYLVPESEIVRYHDTVTKVGS